MGITMLIGIAAVIAAVLLFLTRQADRGSKRPQNVRDSALVGAGTAEALWTMRGLWRLLLALAWGFALYAFSIFLIRNAPESARLVIGFIGFLLALTFGWRAGRP